MLRRHWRIYMLLARSPRLFIVLCWLQAAAATPLHTDEHTCVGSSPSWAFDWSGFVAGVITIIVVVIAVCALALVAITNLTWYRRSWKSNWCSLNCFDLFHRFALFHLDSARQKSIRLDTINLGHVLLLVALALDWTYAYRRFCSLSASGIFWLLLLLLRLLLWLGLLLMLRMLFRLLLLLLRLLRLLLFQFYLLLLLLLFLLLVLLLLHQLLLLL
mmetsp:Transcript_104723/g.168555  ORF Transcript_104723/g.168555 Transcript_104723/m.168555 type:complete len:216 (-) Transcript_104723:1125-1772(-)